MNQELALKLWRYDSETGVFTWRERHGNKVAGSAAGSVDSDGYRHLGYEGKRYKEHRVAWLYVVGTLADDIEIDHRDRVRSNNAFTNLRLATRAQNAQNMNARTDGFRGVYWFPRTSKWVVFFNQNKKQRNLGYFGSLIDAVATRIHAEREHYTHSAFGES